MNRYISLDVLRGLTIIGMILANNAGEGGYVPFFRHVSWNGCTGADCVYPFFLFVMGASIWFSMRKGGHELTPSVSVKIVKRGLLIFAVGLLLNYFPFTGELSHLRIMGIMQRIALVYVGASFLALWLKTPLKILSATLIIMLGYWGLLVGTNSLSADTLSTNILRLADLKLFGENHLLRMHGHPFDPEGSLGSVSALANALLGYVCGMWLGTSENRNKTSGLLLLAGGGMIGVSLLWQEILPFNKVLWTSSFALYTSSCAAVLWAALVWIIDVRGWQKWTSIFRVFGTNALLAYSLSQILATLNYILPFTFNGEEYTVSHWLHVHVYEHISSGYWYCALWGITMILVCWLLIYPLYRKKIYVRL